MRCRVVCSGDSMGYGRHSNRKNPDFIRPNDSRILLSLKHLTVAPPQGFCQNPTPH